eukprot:COSAG01_NODE_44284_length_420_cov_2.049844_1_plen_77_part_00
MRSDADVPSDSRDPDELQALTVVHLKARCKAQGLAVTGKKAELIKRLVGTGTDARSGDTESDFERGQKFFARNNPP